MDKSFEREVIDRLARIETKLETHSGFGDRITKLETSGTRFTVIATAFATIASSLLTSIPSFLRHG